MEETTLKHSDQDYHAAILVDEDRKNAFEKITRVSEWWTKSFKGGSRKVGDTFSVTFGKTFVDFRVTEFVPGNRIVWKVTDCSLHWIQNKKEWKDTEIVWDVTEENGRTRIGMTHVGLVPDIECYSNCNDGWNFYVHKSLLGFLTMNQGKPDKG